MLMYQKQKKPTPASSAAAAGAAEDAQTKIPGAVLRLQKDFSELKLPAAGTGTGSSVAVTIVRDEIKSPLRFSVILRPDTGYWKGGMYEWSIAVPDHYPFKEPRIRCIDKIYHPNISLDGGDVCFQTWKSTSSIQTVIDSLIAAFLQPDALSAVMESGVAELMRNHPTQFALNVAAAMRGETVGGVAFPKNRGAASAASTAASSPQ